MPEFTTQVNVYRSTEETQTCLVTFDYEGDEMILMSVVISEDFEEGCEDDANWEDSLTNQQRLDLETLAWDHVVDYVEGPYRDMPGD